MVDEPVQRDVQLRDERTTIGRRPATGAVTGQPMGREYEVREVHEEPVVQKTVQAGEELVVRKEAAETTERLADTVKRRKPTSTKLDVHPDLHRLDQMLRCLPRHKSSPQERVCNSGVLVFKESS